MDSTSTTDTIDGYWIWCTSPNAVPGRPQHCLFRRDVILENPPATSEIWIACHCAYTLYVNGRFVANGPVQHPEGQPYVCHYDISAVMQMGVNSIGIHCTYDPMASLSHRPWSEGVWAMLVCDSIITCATNKHWLALPLDCYIDTALTASPSRNAVEILDLHTFPESWLEFTQQRWDEKREYRPGNLDWQRPLELESIKKMVDQLEIAPEWHLEWEAKTEPEVVLRGTAQLRAPEKGVIQLSFAPAFRESGKPGVYVAETYLRLEQDCTDYISVFAPTVCKISINGQFIHTDETWMTPECRIPLGKMPDVDRGNQLTCYREEVSLHAGWNRIMVAQYCPVERTGLTIIWEFLKGEKLAIFCKQAIDASDSWMLSGPMKAPLQLIPPNFSPANLPCVESTYEDDLYQDISAYLIACHVTKSPEFPPPYEFPIYLLEQQTLVLDFGQTLYGCPEIRIQGHEGDVLDIIAGEHLIDSEVIAFENASNRNTSTLLLKDQETPFEWMANTPCGFRYVMIIARQTRQAIRIESVGAQTQFVHTESHGDFLCANDALNDIWQLGVNTLNTTYQGYFLDSPTKGCTQVLPDAMMQSIAACFSHGAYDAVAQSLRAFAQTQLETGEISSVVPSGYFQAVPDFSLLWVIWLQKYVYFTHDVAILDEMLPTMTALLEYFHSLTIDGKEVLPALGTITGNQPFLDYADLERDGISTGLNAIYCRALRAASWLANEAGDTTLANTYAAHASMAVDSIRAMTWQPEKGLFSDAYLDNGPSPLASWQTNALALYGGLATGDEAEQIWTRFVSDKLPYELLAAGDSNSPYFKYFVLDVAFALNKHQWACDVMQYYWGCMIDSGATTHWELFDPGAPDFTERTCSHCQGNAAYTNEYIVTEIAGIKPLAAGMQLLQFKPAIDVISSCQLTLPLPENHQLSIAWNLDAEGVIQINMSSNCDLEIVPILSPDVAENAVFNISERISILAQEV